MQSSEAFAAIALAAVGCDGQLGREEALALRSQLEFRTPFRDASEQAMGELFDGLLTQLREQGVSSLIVSAASALSASQRETALALAAHLVFADRQVQPEEQAFLQELSGVLSLAPDRAETILEVIAVLHRDALA
jgi:tellurite resistance protein